MLMDGEREKDGDQGERGETVEEEIETNTMGLQKENRDVVREIVALIEYVAQLANYRKTQKKECCSLLRRLKLLLPLMEEIRDLDTPIPDEAVVLLLNLKKVVLMARKLLKTCNDGSKIYLALESEAFMIRFQAVYEKLTQALDGLPYDELGTSDEVREQVELMSEQLRRAKKRKDTQDIEFAVDMMVAFSKTDQANADSAILERLANKLELQTVEDLKIETEAVRNLLIERGGQISESSQQIIDILNKFKGNLGMEISHILDDPGMTKMQHKSGSSAIPHEFLCPITLEIMTDPVIIASGQTYERESIRQWFDSNHQTCPKTGQTLAHLSLAPNYALKNLIVQWCEKNNFKLPQKEQPDIPSCSERTSDERREEISSLVENLSSNQLEVQRRAVKQIRMLSKENPENRVLIAEGGAIPPLVQLLSYPDSKIEEHAVTALLNLSIDEANKKLISREGAIPAIIEVLQNGSTEARENSAAALFSLSMLDENKVTVGLSNGIPPLIDLLQNGTMRGRKDAATALFNLSLNSANKGRAIDAGIVPPLLKLLKDKNLGMVDEALSIFLLLASHHEGRQEIGQPSFVETLVDFIREGTPKNRECATSVLLELGSNNSSFVLTALQLGVYEHLTEITRTGTNRAQRKANALLQLMSKLEQIP